MELGKKIKSILGGIGILFTVIIMVTLELMERAGVFIVMLILSVWLVAYGIRLLHFYSSMARHMVGGKVIMIMGFILLDFGIFNLALADRHTVFIILYLLGFYAFKGFVDIMRAFEQKRNEDRWKLKLSVGVVHILVAIAALVTGFFLRSEEAVVIIFAIGLVYSAAMRIVSAFRKTPVMTIL